ncbi:type VI secretion system PAAR protein [Vibrio mangrovi]|uniref:PAAR motif protein n=1 Tax=Vibrio mangrovi TaxID=474394 RepID=A0A1Y6IT80_9VIBR|nr:type VI secretion system PAAR protein [Vibrio mangrovi]MDW6004548.1 type VI secretion system PAAR protein [Vibrio mangrovi]SMS00836.1 PAAR motif protein [Vibrio mangrovi]
MGEKAAKLGDLGTAHDGFPPTPIITGSPDVFIDSMPAARVSDQLTMHSKPMNPPHPRKITEGVSTVLVNGLPIAINGSSINCGGVVVGTGSVIVGTCSSSSPTKEIVSASYDEAFVLYDEEAGLPLANTEYRILRADGSYEYGTTDSNGATHLITNSSQEEIEIEIKG